MISYKLSHHNEYWEKIKNKILLSDKDEQKHKSSDSWKGWPQSGEEAVSDNKTYAEVIYCDFLLTICLNF